MKILSIFVFSTFIVLFSAYLLSYLEYRICSFLGHTPHQKGYTGLLLPISNVIKMLSKLNYEENKSGFAGFFTPIAAICPVLVIFCLLFSNNTNNQCNISLNILTFLTLATLSFVSMFFAIFSNKKNLVRIGAIRFILQAFNLAIPLIISILTAAIMAGSLDLNKIMQAQAGLNGIFGWFFIPGILACVAFFVCILIYLNMFSSNTENLLYNELLDYTEKSYGADSALLLLSKNGLLLSGVVLMTFLFFGGGLNPFGTWFLPNNFTHIEQFFWMSLKVLIIVTILFFVKETIVRPSCTKVLTFIQNIILPVSMINFVITLIIQYNIGLKF